MAIEPSDAIDLLRKWLRRARKNQFAHFAAAKTYGRSHLWIGCSTALLTAAVGTSIFSTIDAGLGTQLALLLGVVSFLSSLLSSLQTFLRFDERADKHRQFGASYGQVRRRIEAALVSAAGHPTHLDTIDEIRQTMDGLAVSAPYISPAIWEKSRVEAEKDE